MGNAINGHFVWYDHLTQDPKAAIGFYSEVVGWKTQPFGQDDHYVMWVSGQGPLGGVMTLPEQAARMGAPPHWMGHVQVGDVDATTALARQLGGKVHKEPTDIATVGRFAVIADPQGAAIAVFKPLGAMSSHDSSKEGEFCWSELMTSDSDAALEFYSRLFGWKLLQEVPTPMGPYRIYGVGDQGLGGMMTAKKGTSMPPMWIYYADTRDLDAALGRATRKGARVMNGPMEVPSGSRIVQLTDPQGAVFALHEAAKK